MMLRDVTRSGPRFGSRGGRPAAPDGSAGARDRKVAEPSEGHGRGCRNVPVSRQSLPRRRRRANPSAGQTERQDPKSCRPLPRPTPQCNQADHRAGRIIECGTHGIDAPVGRHHSDPDGPGRPGRRGCRRRSRQRRNREPPQTHGSSPRIHTQLIDLERNIVVEIRAFAAGAATARTAGALAVIGTLARRRTTARTAAAAAATATACSSQGAAAEDRADPHATSGTAAASAAAARCRAIGDVHGRDANAASAAAAARRYRAEPGHLVQPEPATALSHRGCASASGRNRHPSGAGRSGWVSAKCEN